MNLFQIVLLDGILLLFPMLIFLMYLSTNKNINVKSKEMYFNLTLFSSFFLSCQYGVNKPVIIPMLILNSIIIICYLKDRIILANFFAVLILAIYNPYFYNVWILLFVYIIAILLYIIKKKINMKNHLFIELFIISNSFIYFVWLYLYNNSYFNLRNIILLFFSYLFIVNIVYMLYETGKKVLEVYLSYKELQQEKQIRLSLFKITHEIKNPIAVCKGYLDMINVKDKKQVERYIPIIKSEIERLLSLLQDFLLINKSNLDLDIMDLNMLVEETIEKFTPLLNENNITLETNIIDDEVYINGDYNRLSQVILNLLKNSVEAMENIENGKIFIKTKIENDKLLVSIRDNGEGMREEVLERIKEPFYTTKNRGSGLGVALCYEIVEAHSGDIKYLSEYGKGTEVVLTFPIYND